MEEKKKDFICTWGQFDEFANEEEEHANVSFMASKIPCRGTQ